jgi:hypothetical protein
MIGAAARLVSGAAALTRPNVHATSGSDTMLATVEARRPITTVRRQPFSRVPTTRRPRLSPATRAMTPTTLS